MKRICTKHCPVQGFLAVAAVLSLSMSGCSGDDAQFFSEPPLGSESAVDGSADDGVGSDLMLVAHDLAYSSLSEGIVPSPQYYQILKQCMNEQGFDYITPPSPEFLIPLNEMTELFRNVAGLDPTSSLFRSRYGYGVTTVDVYLSYILHPIDPNAEMLLEMDAAEQRAWNTALYGQNLATFADPEYQSRAEELSGDIGPVEFGGCVKEANDATGMEYAQARNEALELIEAVERVESSQGFVRIEQDWVQCTAEKGYDHLISFDSITSLLYGKLDAIVKPDPFMNLSDEEIAVLPEEEFQKMTDMQGSMYDLEDLAKVQQEELDLAQDLADCDIAYWTGFAEIEDILFPDG